MKWLIVALLWAVALLNYLDRQVVFSLFPLLQRDLHASALQLGFIGTVFLWTYGLLSPFAGFVADRLGRARVIVASLVVWSVATLLTAHVGDLRGMLLTRVLMGASEAFYLPAALALIAELHTDSTRSLATGIHQSGLYTGLVLGGAWGGWMGDHAGWRPAFQILGVIGAGYAVVLAAVLLRGQEAGRQQIALFGESFKSLGRVGAFSYLLMAFAAMAVVNWIVYTWLPLFLFERFHLSMTGAGFSATFYVQAASYAGAIAGGLLTDRWVRRNARARIYMGAFGMAIAAPFLVLMSLAVSQLVLAIALITFGLGRGLFDCNTMPTLLQIVPRRYCATGYGILNAVGCVMGGAGAAAAGFIKEQVGLSLALQGAGLVLFAGAFVILRIRISSPST
jgi:MFS family permease